MAIKKARWSYKHALRTKGIRPLPSYDQLRTRKTDAARHGDEDHHIVGVAACPAQ